MDNKLNILIKELTEKNLNKGAVWQKTSGEGEFKIQLNKATLTIDKWNDEDGDNFSLDIYNENGEKIKQIHTMASLLEDAENFALLSDLYNSVINTYYKTDETIDSIINEIKNKDIIGK